MSDIVLETKSLTKSYAGIVALRDFDIQVRQGEIHALVGENGAGKSTLIQTLVGAHRPDSGEMIFNGNEVSFSSPVEATDMGISAVFQELSVVDNMSVAENIYINRQPTKLGGFVDRKKINEDAEKLLTEFGIDNIDPKVLVGNLSIAHKQQVEIMKAISYNPKVLILDEPTSSLTDKEVKILFKNMRLLRDKGVGLIYISHHMNEIFEIADTITIMRDGAKVCDVVAKDVDEQFLISNMVGREIGDIYAPRGDDPIGDVVFEAKNLSVEGEFADISLEVRQGEIVALAGLVGAGRTEVGLSLFGIMPPEQGEIYIDGGKVEIKSPQDALHNGIGYVTEDRKKEGLFLNLSIKMNLLSNKIDRFHKGIMMDDRSIAKNAEALRQSFNIVSRGIDQEVASLSGGNQQKVMIAEWFDIGPRLLIIDEPTRGVDVGAKSEIYAKIRELARQGTATILISSDMMEVLGMADRVVVMKAGRITGILDREEASEEAVLALAFSKNN